MKVILFCFSLAEVFQNVAEVARFLAEVLKKSAELLKKLAERAYEHFIFLKKFFRFVLRENSFLCFTI